MSEWRLIDTAPDDGTEILGAWYVSTLGSWIREPVMFDKGEWIVAWDGDPCDPTHWLPLPAPPD